MLSGTHLGECPFSTQPAATAAVQRVPECDSHLAPAAELGWVFGTFLPHAFTLFAFKAVPGRHIGVAECQEVCLFRRPFYGTLSCVIVYSTALSTSHIYLKPNSLSGNYIGFILRQYIITEPWRRRQWVVLGPAP